MSTAVGCPGFGVSARDQQREAGKWSCAHVPFLSAIAPRYIKLPLVIFGYSLFSWQSIVARAGVASGWTAAEVKPSRRAKEPVFYTRNRYGDPFWIGTFWIGAGGEFFPGKAWRSHRRAATTVGEAAEVATVKLPAKSIEFLRRFPTTRTRSGRSLEAEMATGSVLRSESLAAVLLRLQ